jgi:hypothetical protein
MGSAQSIITPESALTTAVVVGAVAFSVAQRRPTAPTPSSSDSKTHSTTALPGQFDSAAEDSTGPTPTTKKKKSKGKAKAAAAEAPAPPPAPPVVETPPPVPAPAPAPEPSKKSKKKNKSKASSKPATEGSASDFIPPSTFHDTDSSWTRVESSSRRREVESTTTDAEPEPAVDNRKTLAEKLVPKPKKTGVEECVVLFPLILDHN